MHKKKYEHNEMTDNIIRSVYSSKSYGDHRRSVPIAMRKLGWPKYVLYNRAVQLGLVEPKRKQPDWSEKENDVLEEYSGESDESIQRILIRKGFIKRSLCAIQVQRKRIGCGIRQGRIDNGIFSATQASIILGVSSKTVVDWIYKKLLPAKKLSDGRLVQHLISAKNIRIFAGNNPELIDLSKADKIMFITLMAGKYE